ncbi:MAG: hypothetical protein ABW123_14565 [Cystobacter sp.]
MRGVGSSWVLLVCGVVACGPLPSFQEGTSEATETLAVTYEELTSENGESFNGLAFNGLAFNGLAFNGLSSAAFSDWYHQDPELADNVMKYVTACALPADETRTYKDKQGRTRLWRGGLGLAPDWINGQPATLLEQQLVSACLAAHVNKFGRTVPISIQGRTGRNQPIATSAAELQTFSQREGCFFGNLFTQQGVFVGHDDRPLRPYESSVRTCALGVGRDGCAPITQVGACNAKCVPDPSQPYYTRCTHNGTTYAALTTRIRPQDIYSCGDGVCQFTESPGLGLSADHCAIDCGVLGR